MSYGDMGGGGWGWEVVMMQRERERGVEIGGVREYFVLILSVYLSSV